MTDFETTGRDSTEDLAGPEVIETRKVGVWLLHNPSTNQATAFDRAQRDELHVRGMVPHRVTTLAEQATAAIAQIRAKDTPLEQYIGMASLHDRNEVLFYRVLVDHIAELMPIVYTPTVGEACQKFSQIYRSARGLWITPDDVHDIPKVLRNSPYHDIRLIVATDNERILGLGDQGVGGIAIPIGKLALYVAGAGIHPSKCLPISLDVGTNNPALLADPSISAIRRNVCEVATTTTSSRRSCAACAKCIRGPSCSGKTSTRIARSSCSSVTRSACPRSTTTSRVPRAWRWAGYWRGFALRSKKWHTSALCSLGAGAACTGIARLWAIAMREDGADEATIRRALFAMDSQGLLHDGRTIDEPHKHALAVPREAVLAYGLDPNAHLTPLEVIRAVKPTIIVGATAHAGHVHRGDAREHDASCGATDCAPAQQSDDQGRVHGGRSHPMDPRSRHRGHGQSLRRR
jgi:malic enzyme